jgi:hypothetical protein
LKRRLAAFHQHHAIAIEDDGAHPDHGSIGKASQEVSPSTFTTTRFFRCPSNSA